MNDLTASIQRYIRFVLAETKLSPRGLALKANISPTTLTRFLNSADHKFNISNTTVQKIAEASGISPSLYDFHTQANLAKPSFQITSSIKAHEAGKGWVTPIDYDIRPGVWIETDIYCRLSTNVMIGIPLTSKERNDFFAEVHDNSVSDIAQNGDVLYCERLLWDKNLDEIENNNLYVIERSLEEETLTECSARLLRREGERVIATFPTADEAMTGSVLILDSRSPTFARFHIVGCVRSVVRPFRPKRTMLR